MNSVRYGCNGIEIDMLSLGDADCIIVTCWVDSYPHRILIDGGSGGSYEEVAEFLLSRGYTTFWAVVCSHCHGDHASGLIKLIRDLRFSFHNGWMHDVRNHITIDALRRASRADDGVRQVVDTTIELARAFAWRSISVREPFVGEYIAGLPNLTVLGPTQNFYRGAVADFTGIHVPPPLSAYAALAAQSSFGNSSPNWSAIGNLSAASGLYSPPPAFGSLASMFSGALAGSSLEEKPKTQPYNNTSTILGMIYGSYKYIFTADAGSKALDQVPKEWNSIDWMQVPHHGSDGNLSPENIERFCPRVTYVSAKGDTSHPSRAIVNGLIRVRSAVYSTHTAGHLWHSRGNVPSRSGYGPAEPLRATGGMKLPLINTIPW